MPRFSSDQRTRVSFFIYMTMRYKKPPISIAAQIQLLEQRGLIIEDFERAKHYLSTISFYRFRAYTYPFQNNTARNHRFNQGITFEHCLNTYLFDRELRLLVFDAIERIEIALRTQLIHKLAMTHGSHWYEEASLFRQTHLFVKDLNSLYKEIDRSKETFIEHYRTKYNQPVKPPAWMSLEVATLGVLSRIYENLKKSPETKSIANFFGLPIVDLLESWMHGLSYVRNICAHHGRLWNRKLTKAIIIPKGPQNVWIQNKEISNEKLYIILCALVYLLNIISPNHSWKNKLKSLLLKYPEVDIVQMGFPIDWEQDSFWI